MNFWCKHGKFFPQTSQQKFVRSVKLTNTLKKKHLKQKLPKLRSRIRDYRGTESDWTENSTFSEQFSWFSAGLVIIWVMRRVSIDNFGVEGTKRPRRVAERQSPVSSFVLAQIKRGGEIAFAWVRKALGDIISRTHFIVFFLPVLALLISWFYGAGVLLFISQTPRRMGRPAFLSGVSYTWTTKRNKFSRIAYSTSCGFIIMMISSTSRRLSTWT